MNRLSRPTLILLLATSLVYPCLWPEGERYQVGKPIDLEGTTPVEYVQKLTTAEGREYWEKLLATLEQQKKNHPIMSVENNIAVALVHLGRYKEALEILKTEEKRRQGNSYFTAANLGTTYELLGENDEALRWIRESVRRDPRSHFGTEWLHIKILEAKIALEKDPKWLERNTVLGIQWDGINRDPSADISVIDFQGKKKSAKEIEDAIAYQLHERMEFVKPPDPIVGQLLFDLSNLLVTSRSPEHAKAVHQLAVNYGHKSAAPVVTAPIPIAPSVSTPDPVVTPDSSKLGTYGVIGGSVLAIFLLAAGYYFYRRRQKSSVG